MVEYLNILQWQELDLHQHYQMKDPKGLKQLAEMIERDRVFEFLNGLEWACSWQRTFFLLRRVCSYVSNEEDRNAVLTRTTSAEHLVDVSTLKSEFKKFNPYNGGNQNKNKKEETDSRWCDY
ncbi:hypothetical protein PanWU01x14_254880 [Parasponia andersonii]|uniref:Uncharacterized protein n=1 Tax=Parasponia andersonii TaxID=3476 RepID=A0A2P5BB23_PARAD|nr:hypothetical protein PanWU01x14_254880 [Parasponia andersonii]